VCGRYALYAAPEDVARAFGLATAPPVAARWNIAPGGEVLAVRLGGAGRECARLHWGLVPHWASDPAAGPRPVNARIETAADRPLFRSAFRDRRCLIPASGFYEWRREGRRRVPFFVFPAHAPLIAFAGLWERWQSGGVLESCAILTAAAKGELRALHERMPLVLPPAAYDAWLERGKLPGANASAVELRFHRVSPAVNSAANDGPALILPAG